MIVTMYQHFNFLFVDTETEVTSLLSTDLFKTGQIIKHSLDDKKVPVLLLFESGAFQQPQLDNDDPVLVVYSLHTR